MLGHICSKARAGGWVEEGEGNCRGWKWDFPGRWVGQPQFVLNFNHLNIFLVYSDFGHRDFWKWDGGGKKGKAEFREGTLCI